jgi:hypothetical protein
MRPSKNLRLDARSSLASGSKADVVFLDAEIGLREDEKERLRLLEFSFSLCPSPRQNPSR